MTNLDPALLAGTLDTLREGLQILSPDLRYLYVNAAVERHGKKRREELLGRTMTECYPGIEQTAMFAVLTRCMRDRQPAVIENEFVYDDGTRAWFELRMQPCDEGLIVLSLDVTGRKKLELELREANQRLLQEMSSPVIRVRAGVLLLPLVGTLEAGRAAQITDVVLSRVEAEHAKVLILDVSGVPVMDTAVADHLLQMVAALKLLGAQAILTGISASAARTIVQLGVDLSVARTTTQLADGIDIALELV